MTNQIHYHDETTGLTLVLAEAKTSPELWQAFLAGARRRYKLYDAEEMVFASQTAVLRGIERFSVVMLDGRPIAGARTRGALGENDLPVCKELDGFPAFEMIHNKVRSRLSEGVLEGKTGWMDNEFRGDSTSIAPLLVAGLYLQLPQTGCRWIVAALSPFSVPVFTRYGGVMDSDIKPVPFPKPDILTGVVWFDRNRLEAQIAKFLPVSHSMNAGCF
ncbi:hypothetical protein [Pseudovibrio sp. Ad37]|uniref:hypothetical protein n=1 Tax=Pseudovibrio sp. Ad37 TaxID=989422 RepID=UPI0007AEB8FF|nr:hypothetical protein [Pseudovibrio sp. Ad37]KZL27716.1 hypothetical protein PsAD37_01155 [Pseudovibrio sp. Ad37]